MSALSLKTFCQRVWAHSISFCQVGLTEHFTRGALPNHFPFIQHTHPVRFHQVFDPMSGNDDRDPFCFQLFQEQEKLLPARGVEIGQRLVHDDDPRFPDQDRCHHQTLPLPS